MAPAEVWRNRLSDLKLLCEQTLRLDPQKEPVPVTPGIHYFMGGILVDAEHRTNIRFLYAAGECACQYHGANRLGGNSLLGATLGGITAAKQAISEKGPSGNPPRVDVPFDEAHDLTNAERQDVSAILADGLSIIRTEERILRAMGRLSEIRPPDRRGDELLLGTAMLRSALERRESRGAHFREDFSQMDDRYRKTTAANYDGKDIHINFQNIPSKTENTISFTPEDEFVWTTGMVSMARLLSKTPQNRNQRIKEAYQKYYDQDCSHFNACHGICPAGMDTAHLAVHSKAAVLLNNGGAEI